MALGDREIPFFRQRVGTVQAYPFNFEAVIPTGMQITAYDVALEAAGSVEHDAGASILSPAVVLVALRALTPGETLVTVIAHIGENGLKEAVEARLCVEGQAVV